MRLICSFFMASLVFAFSQAVFAQNSPLTVKLNHFGNIPTNGTATITSNGTGVTIKVTATTPDGTGFVQLVKGTCTSHGDPVQRLTPLSGGASTTDVSMSLSDLTGYALLIPVNQLKSGMNNVPYAACGEIK